MRWIVFYKLHLFHHYCIIFDYIKVYSLGLDFNIRSKSFKHMVDIVTQVCWIGTKIENDTKGA